MTTIADFSATDIAGKDVSLADYQGKVVLVVNTASKCGFTPQYEGLESTYKKYADQGFVILGFPCDQFGHQEPGTETDIKDFCEVNYGVTFPLFAKIDVNGANADPLFKWLRSERGGVLGDKIKWNFTKFLVGRDGLPAKRFGSTTKPEKLADDIERALAG